MQVGGRQQNKVEMIAVGHLARCVVLRELRPNQDCPHGWCARDLTDDCKCFSGVGICFALGAQKSVPFSKKFWAKCYGCG